MGYSIELVFYHSYRTLLLPLVHLLTYVNQEVGRLRGI